MAPDARLRRSFARRFGAGVGVAAVVTSLVTLRWDIPGNASTSVSAAGPDWPVPVLFSLLLAGAAIAVGAGAYRAAGVVLPAGRARLRFAVVWAVVATAAAAANAYLAYFPAPDGLLALLPGGSLQERLLLTLPLAGALGGLASGIVLHAAGGRVALSAALWFLAMLLAAYLAAPVVYLGVGGTIDLLEALSLSPGVGRAVGTFLSSLLVGYLAAALGAVATVPALQALRDSEPK